MRRYYEEGAFALGRRYLSPLAIKIRRFRSLLNMTQEDFAKELDISRQIINDIENDISNNISALIKISCYLDNCKKELEKQKDKSKYSNAVQLIYEVKSEIDTKIENIKEIYQEQLKPNVKHIKYAKSIYKKTNS